MAALWAITVLIAIVGSCHAQTCIFDVPPPAGPTKDYTDNTAYTVGTVQQITWRMDVDTAQLLLWQDNHPGDPIGGDHVIITENTNAEAFHWTVSYEGMDPSINNVFYFQVVASDCTFTSHYFNLTGTESATTSSTSSLVTATSTFSGPTSGFSTLGSSTTSTSASSTSTPSTSTTAAPPASNSSSGGSAASSNNINIGLVAGISIVGSLVFIVAVLGAGYFLRRWYRKRKLEKQKSIEHGGQGQAASQRRKGSILVGEMQELGEGEEARELEVVENVVELDHQGRMLHYELQ